jgi:PAS domain S-box-containing protein
VNTNNTPRTASLTPGPGNSSVANAVSLEHLLTLLPDLAFIHDLQEGRHVYCNARLEPLLGLSAEKFLKSGFAEEPELFHPDDRGPLRRWSAHLGKLKDHEISQIDYRMRHVDGRWRRLRVRAAPALRDPEGALRLLTCSAQDIADETDAGSPLPQQHEVLRLILNSMTEGVIVCDQHGKTLLVNRSAERMLKLDEPLTRLSQIRRAQAAETRKNESFRLWHQHPLVRALNGETLSDQELSLYDRRRDLAVTLSHCAAPLKDSEGKIIGAVDVGSGAPARWVRCMIAKVGCRVSSKSCATTPSGDWRNKMSFFWPIMIRSLVCRTARVSWSGCTRR